MLHVKAKGLITNRVLIKPSRQLTQLKKEKKRGCTLIHLTVSIITFIRSIVGQIEENKKKNQPTTQNVDEDLKLIEEKGEDTDDINLPAKDLQKKAQEFVKENYEKFITKKKPKAKQQQKQQ